MRYSALGLAVMCVHQMALSLTSLSAWASSNTAARRTLVEQNKEGLVSLPGYFAIYLLGLDLGHYILPRDPYLAYRRLTRTRQRDKLDKLAMVLVSFAVLWWGAFYLEQLIFGGLVSRRLVRGRCLDARGSSHETQSVCRLLTDCLFWSCFAPPSSRRQTCRTCSGSRRTTPASSWRM